jgi:hypothetical protein
LIRDEYALPVMAQVISSDLVIFGSLNSVTYCTPLSFLCFAPRSEALTHTSSEFFAIHKTGALRMIA